MRSTRTAIVMAVLCLSAAAGCTAKYGDIEDPASADNAESVNLDESSSNSGTATSDIGMTDSGTSDLTLTAPGAEQTAATVFISPDGAYSVEYPYPPSAMGVTSSATAPDGTTFRVWDMIFPTDDLDKGVAHLVDGTVTEVTAGTVGGRDARRFEYQEQVDGVTEQGVGLVTIDHGTAYIVQSSGPGGSLAASAAFVDSFRLLRPAE